MLYSVLYDPADLTIQNIARLWKHSKTNYDTAGTAGVLGAMLAPQHDRTEAYLKSHDLEDKLPVILSKILLGVAPRSPCSKAQQAKALLAAFSERILGTTGRCLPEQIVFLLAVLKVSRQGDSEPEVIMDPVLERVVQTVETRCETMV